MTLDQQPSGCDSRSIAAHNGAKTLVPLATIREALPAPSPARRGRLVDAAAGCGIRAARAALPACYSVLRLSYPLVTPVFLTGFGNPLNVRAKAWAATGPP